VLRGDLPRLSRTTHIVTSSTSSPIKRSKPLKYAYEKEIVLYAHHKKLDYFSTECIYSPEAFRGSARALIKNLERVRPSAILDVVRSGEDMAKLVPEEISTQRCAGGSEAAQVEGEGEGEGPGGCGSGNGRSSGGEMVDMERRLIDNEAAREREVEITSTSAASGGTPAKGNSPVRRQQQQGVRAPRKLPRQHMGQCIRCGYLSSQEVCKACVLLEGLNKNRPRTAIEVGLEDEEGSSSLRRRMESVALAGG
jgi:cytoplasmic tRNA 2-thiolation protein 1